MYHLISFLEHFALAQFAVTRERGSLPKNQMKNKMKLIPSLHPYLLRRIRIHGLIDHTDENAAKSVAVFRWYIGPRRNPCRLDNRLSDILPDNIAYP